MPPTVMTPFATPVAAVESCPACPADPAVVRVRAAVPCVPWVAPVPDDAWLVGADSVTPATDVVPVPMLAATATPSPNAARRLRAMTVIAIRSLIGK